MGVRAYGYARVSTADQTLDLQIDALNKYGVSKIFQEKASGAKDDREELKKVLDRLDEGDTLVVYKLDRLARSTGKLIQVLDDIKIKGAHFISINDSIDTTTAAGKALFGMLAVFAEFERNIIVERTQAGLKAARSRGRKGGRPVSDQKKLEQALKLYDSETYTVKEIEELTSVKRATLYRAIAKRKTQLIT
ncbi:recombinase family protein [Paenibacillus sacheonensis]|uniref:Recombinase family protein n=1 Tax=Paenibacillus sacheonensis TaxID=742054 RepID=A0A7X5C256_9BACL|nr:recombinase family protein [Paenibacillus sacheonensis]MBM7564311.1 DNA invertase Pin-like site-specific DNA recombinase [Paenibacillus sacheonensis]NBC73456.1 recombinase family protein [Paenibacillus sacheonensis]